jgi:hypothetical protein
MPPVTQEGTTMGDTLDDIYWERQARYEREARQQEDLTVLRSRQRKEFMSTLLAGDDMSAWLAPNACEPSDEVLSEHMAQLRNAVRYALQFALADDMTFERNMSAANAATRMIQANIALSKALKAPNSKTVRGVRHKEEPQD